MIGDFYFREENKMKIDDDGNVIIRLSEIIEATPTGEIDKIIDEFGFATQIWQRVADALRNEYSASSFNPAIHEIRQAVFSDMRLVPYALVRVVSDLVDRTKAAETKAEAYCSAYFKLYHAWLDNVGRPCPVSAPKYEPECANGGSVEKLLEQWLGETLRECKNAIEATAEGEERDNGKL